MERLKVKELSTEWFLPFRHYQKPILPANISFSTNTVSSIRKITIKPNSHRPLPTADCQLIHTAPSHPELP